MRGEVPSIRRRGARQALGIAFASLVVTVVVACGPVPPPHESFEVVVPPGMTSELTVDEVALKMLARIEQTEKRVGRARAPRRIIRVRLLAPGESATFMRLNGQPSPFGTGAVDRPMWFVEAVGTFQGSTWSQSEDRLGMHGFGVYADDRSEDAEFNELGFLVCRADAPLPASMTEGNC